MTEASSLKPGQWLIRTSGAYLVDAVAVKAGRAYIGTNRGIVVLAAHAPVLVGDPGCRT